MNYIPDPKISVVMPVYNCTNFIDASVSSILNQSFTDFELIIIDDFSTDGTFEYINSIKDPRVKIIRKENNTGLTKSLNLGICLSRGKYIARMDGDDISLPDRFSKQWDFMEKNPDVVVCGGAYKAIGADLTFVPKVTNDEIVHELFYATPIAHPTAFLRLSILKENKIFYQPEYELAEDYKMWTVLSEYGKLANIRDILLEYRIHTGQITKIKSEHKNKMKDLVSFEYIFKLSGYHEKIEYFCNKNSIEIADVVKYEEVESKIKFNLIIQGVEVNESYFMNRKVEYIKEGLKNEKTSFSTLFKNLNFIYKYIHFLGTGYIIKYILKCLIPIK